MENLLFRLEQLYNSRTKHEEDLLLQLRNNNPFSDSVKESINILNEYRIRIDEIESHILIAQINELKEKLNIFNNKIIINK